MGGISCKDQSVMPQKFYKNAKKELMNYEFYKNTKSTNLRLITANETDDIFTKNTKMKVYLKKWLELISLNKIQFSEMHSLNLSDNILGIILELLEINEYLLIKYLSKGPPNRFRWHIWLAFVLHQEKNVHFIQPELYYQLLSQDLNSESNKQITKDLLRSAPDVKYFQSNNGINSLFNVLKALAINDKELSYCQGLNLLVTNFLLASDGNEVETFFVVKFILSNLKLKGFFLDGFPLLNEYIYIMKKLIKIFLPGINQLIENLFIPDELWIFKWIQTSFSMPLPFEVTIRLWDCLLSFGLDFIFNFTLAFLQYFEKEIITSVTDIGEFIEFFSNKVQNEVQIIKLREALIKKAKKYTIKSQIEAIRKKYYEENISPIRVEIPVNEIKIHSSEGVDGITKMIDFQMQSTGSTFADDHRDSIHINVEIPVEIENDKSKCDSDIEADEELTSEDQEMKNKVIASFDYHQRNRVQK